MTLSQKAVDFTARHQFSVIAGCWALGIAGAFGGIMRDPCVDLHSQSRMMIIHYSRRYQSLSQKVWHDFFYLFAKHKLKGSWLGRSCKRECGHRESRLVSLLRQQQFHVRGCTDEMRVTLDDL
jgi:hypothetical protein